MPREALMMTDRPWTKGSKIRDSSKIGFSATSVPWSPGWGLFAGNLISGNNTFQGVMRTEDVYQKRQ
jgi:hypothetical protein